MLQKNNLDGNEVNIMKDSFFLVDDVQALITDIPADTIISRTYFEADRMKAILFGFAPGQELSEHTASKPAVLHFIEGEADLTLGDDQKTAGPGTWAYMEPNLPHSILAKTKVVMLLLLL
jgi:quercetin dioxygenase-like cupin family protein